MFTVISLVLIAIYFIALPWLECPFRPRERVILPERVALPVVRHQYPPEVRVAFEPYAEQVVRLALVPVGRPPDRAHRRHPGVFLLYRDLQAQRMAVRYGVEVVYDLEARRLRLPVDRGNVH